MSFSNSLSSAVLAIDPRGTLRTVRSIAFLPSRSRWLRFHVLAGSRSRSYFGHAFEDQTNSDIASKSF